MNFNYLVESIERTHLLLKQAVVKAINIHLTLRKWLIGFYVSVAVANITEVNYKIDVSWLYANLISNLSLIIVD